MADRDSRQPHSAWRWFVPSLSHWLWLVLVVVLLAQPWRTMMVASDGDACMHWRVGEQMLTSHQIIRADVFSHTRAGEPIITKEWLAEIIFAAAGRFGGLYGIAVVAALVIATTFALLHWQLVRDGNDCLVAALLVLLAAAAASSHWLARPHVFSLLLAALWNDAVRRFERNGNARSLAVTLGLLALLWVNLHGGFLVGFFILSAYWLGAAFERDITKLKQITGVALVCAAVTLINPNGYRLHLHTIAFLQSSYLKNWLAEYSSADFHSAGTNAFLAWLALEFFTLTLLRPKIDPASGCLLLMWTYFALYANRNIPLFVILSAPILAPALSNCFRQRWSALSDRWQRQNETARGWPVVLAAAVLAIAATPRPTDMPASDWPVNALRYIGDHPEKFAGKMLNHYTWGGYLMQAMPEHKVFVDGRTDFYGEQFIREFTDTMSLSTNWAASLNQYDVRWTLLRSDHRLNQALPLLGWTPAYTDAVATVYSKNP